MLPRISQELGLSSQEMWHRLRSYPLGYYLQKEDGQSAQEPTVRVLRWASQGCWKFRNKGVPICCYCSGTFRVFLSYLGDTQ